MGGFEDTSPEMAAGEDAAVSDDGWRRMRQSHLALLNRIAHQSRN